MGGIFCPAAIAVLLVMSRGSIVGKCFIFFLYGLVTNTNIFVILDVAVEFGYTFLVPLPNQAEGFVLGV